MAPVKAPFSKPNSSDSRSSVGSAAQFTLTNGLSLRSDWACSARATSSLPVPLSPRIRTVTSVSETRSIRSRTSIIFSLLPKSIVDFDLGVLERLADEVRGPERYRLHDRVGPSLGGDRDDGEVAVDLPEGCEG